MSLSLSFLWLLLPLFTSILAYTPLPPSSDAFYQPPSGLQEHSNGEILRSRLLPTCPAGLTTPIEATYQILYRTSDSNGHAQAAMTTLLVPCNATTTKLFSMQNAYDSPATDCAPSYQLHLPTSVIPERSIIDQALAEGWYVSTPDFEGFQSSFTNGIFSGQAVLDSLRAVLASGETTGLEESANVVLAGGSGGALGSEWALELQESYAPELTISGALLTALAPNLTSVFQAIEGQSNSALIPSALLGLAKQSMELSAWLGENLIPECEDSPSFFQAASASCYNNFQQIFGAQNVSQKYFGRADALLDAIPQAVLRQVGIMGQHGIPRVPIFAYKGTADEISPVKDTDSLVLKYCGAGAKIEYVRGVNLTHAESGIEGFEAGWTWVRERLDGVEVQGGCHSKDVVV